VRSFLFGPPGAGGLDLGALDIQRGRDHGLLDYNAFRPAYGLPRFNSINQLTGDPAVRAKLVSLYGNIDNIDPFIGAIAENHAPGSSLGSMLIASFQDQFSRLRDGDRFFYTGDADLQSPTVTSIINLNTLRLSDVIEMNTGVTGLQDNVFLAVTPAPEPSGISLGLIATAGTVLARRRRRHR
jgi:peroxidase